MNKKRIFCDVAITGVIGMCILFLSYKFILKTANPFLGIVNFYDWLDDCTSHRSCCKR